MNAIILGQSTKMAEILSFFCEKVYICLDNSFRGSRYFKELDNYTILRSKSNVKTFKGVLPKSKEIRKWINKYDITIIFSQTKYDMLAAKLASMASRKKIVLLGTSHNSYAWQNDSNVRKMSWLIRCTNDCYVALASFVYDKLKALGLKEDNLVLVPNTIEYKTWDVKNDYFVNGYFKIVYVSYLYHGKRQHFFVDILKALKRKDIVIDCYGDLENVEYVNRIKKDIVEAGLEGQINLKGRIENSELRSILKDYDAYVCPTFMEMSPVNILEAQAAGLPVLASNVGGMSDLITHNENGLLFECDNLVDVTQKIESLIDNKELRERLGRAGRKYVSQTYTAKEASIRIKTKIQNLLFKS